MKIDLIMILKYDKWSSEYRLAERIVHLEEALDLANKLLNDDGNLGVIPSRTVRFRKSANFHKKVREVILFT
jgi:hypothetical protein